MWRDHPLNSCSSIAASVYVKKFSHEIHLQRCDKKRSVSLIIIHSDIHCINSPAPHSPEWSTSIKSRIFELLTSSAHTNCYQLIVQNHEPPNYANAIDTEACHSNFVRPCQLSPVWMRIDIVSISRCIQKPKRKRAEVSPNLPWNFAYPIAAPQFPEHILSIDRIWWL